MIAMISDIFFFVDWYLAHASLGATNIHNLNIKLWSVCNIIVQTLGASIQMHSGRLMAPVHVYCAIYSRGFWALSFFVNCSQKQCGPGGSNSQGTTNANHGELQDRQGDQGAMMWRSLGSGGGSVCKLQEAVGAKHWGMGTHMTPEKHWHAQDCLAPASHLAHPPMSPPAQLPADLPPTGPSHNSIRCLMLAPLAKDMMCLIRSMLQ
jgi:hypothetical protein